MSDGRQTAEVKCRDGKTRRFVTTVDGEVLHFQGRKHCYLLWDELEGRGMVTMMVAMEDARRVYILAPNHMQPVHVVARTWAGQWEWKALGDE